MSDKLATVISRLSMPDLQVVLTPSVLNLINAFQSNPDKSILAEISLDLFGPRAILDTASKRALILENLRKTEASKLCHELMGKTLDADPWEDLKKYKFNSERKRETLYNFFSLEPLVKTVELNPPPPSVETVKTEYPLFSHQQEASVRIKKILKTEDKVLLHMPTGAGKTRTSMNIVSDYLREEPDGLVIWLANSEELCLQACSEFKKAWSYLGSRDVKLHRIFGHSAAELMDIDNGFVVAGLQMLGSRFSSDQVGRSHFAKKAELIVFDEAHMAIAPTYSRIVETFMVQGDAKLLGLTATPGRSTYDEDENEKFAEFFERNKVTLEVKGYDNPVTFLQDNGYLAKASYHSLPHKSEKVRLSEKEIENIADGQEIPKRILKILAEDTKRNLQILTIAMEQVEKKKQIILFAISVAHAEALYALLSYKNIRAGLIVTSTDSTIRRQSIEDYKNGDLDILVNYGVLTTGFDAPKTSVAIIARPTNSLTLFSQMVGRALRGVNAGGNEFCDIFTVIDDELPSFKNMALAFQHWDDLWK